MVRRPGQSKAGSRKRVEKRAGDECGTSRRAGAGAKGGERYGGEGATVPLAPLGESAPGAGGGGAAPYGSPPCGGSGTVPSAPFASADSVPLTPLGALQGLIGSGSAGIPRGRGAFRRGIRESMSLSLPIPESEDPLHGHDHATLALLSFGIKGERRHEPVTVAYQLQLDGHVRRVSVTFHPDAQAGLPTHSDQTVFLALLQLAMRTGSRDGRLQFRLSEVIESLGWSDGGKNYQRLRDALFRLHRLSLVIHAELVARNGKPYRRIERASSIISAYELDTEQGDTSCYVDWGEVIREAFDLQDLKRLDWNLIRALHPTAVQLYRLIDRAALSGERVWSVRWKALAQAVGMSTQYRPRDFRRALEGHLDALVERDVLVSWEYERGGTFAFHLHNHLPSLVREVLIKHGVFPPAAKDLLVAHDLLDIMVQCDCLEHGSRPKANAPGGFLTEAIRQGYDLRYPTDEPDAFVGIWEFFEEEDRRAYHRAALYLCGENDLFRNSEDPTVWPVEFRAIVRFLMTHGVDAAKVR